MIDNKKEIEKERFISYLEQQKQGYFDGKIAFKDLCKNTDKLDFPEIKPPLGLKPRDIFEKQMKENIHFNNKTRLLEILESSLRYLESNLQIPMIWLDEALQINLDLDLSVLEPEKIELKIDKKTEIIIGFNPLDFGFSIYPDKEKFMVWEKIIDRDNFLLFKVEKNLWKIEHHKKNGEIKVYSNQEMDNEKDAKNLFKYIGAI